MRREERAHLGPSYEPEAGCADPGEALSGQNAPERPREPMGRQDVGCTNWHRFDSGLFVQFASLPVQARSICVHS